ncbi:PspA/IM30 family protein [Paenibacillus tarimensis]
MSILKRVRDMTVATLNDRLEKAEDPVKLIDRFLASTREEIAQAEQLYRQCTAHSLQLKRQWLQAEQQAEIREQQAVTALRADAEEAARAALADKAAHDERAAQYKGLFEQSKHTLLELEDRLGELKDEYRSAADKRDYYAARMETLRLRQRWNERHSGRFGRTAGNPIHSDQLFRRLEERIGDEELESRALHELRRPGEASFKQVDPVLQSAVELELQQLRQRLNKGGEQAT